MFPAWFVCLYLCVEFSLGSLSDEFDASIDEVQSLMQTSKGESSIDVSADFRESTTSEDLAADALFLIKATFGPSSTSLDKLQRMTHQEWVAEQMSLPAHLSAVQHALVTRGCNTPWDQSRQGTAENNEESDL